MAPVPVQPRDGQPLYPSPLQWIRPLFRVGNPLDSCSQGAATTDINLPLLIEQGVPMLSHVTNQVHMHQRHVGSKVELIGVPRDQRRLGSGIGMPES